MIIYTNNKFGKTQISIASSNSLYFRLFAFLLFVIVFYFASMEEVIELKNALGSLEAFPNAVLNAGIKTFNQLSINSQLMASTIFLPIPIIKASLQHINEAYAPKDLSSDKYSLTKELKESPTTNTRQINLSCQS